MLRISPIAIALLLSMSMPAFADDLETFENEEFSSTAVASEELNDNRGGTALTDAELGKTVIYNNASSNISDNVINGNLSINGGQISNSFNNAGPSVVIMNDAPYSAINATMVINVNML